MGQSGASSPANRHTLLSVVGPARVRRTVPSGREWTGVATRARHLLRETATAWQFAVYRF